MTAARDADGFAELSSYAVLGDGRSVALVAGDGGVDWWAVPALESPPVLSSLLDPPHGGRFVLRPTADFTVTDRGYLPGTNVLQTTYQTADGTARVTDSLNVGEAGRLPWTELARRVEGLAGQVEMSLELEMGTGLGGWSPWLEEQSGDPVLHAGLVLLALRSSDEVEVSIGRHCVHGTLTTRADSRHMLALVAADQEPLFLPDIAAIERRVDQTVRAWRSWSDLVCWDGPDRDAVLRSALALKLLVRSGTGAIAAAATTSLPEKLGGPKNWDYRYSWVRDASFTVDALQHCGLQEEVHAAVSWLLAAIRRDDDGPHVLYTLTGDVPPTQIDTPDVPGYRGSLPVQTGNAAATQTQLGIYGDLFGTVAAWVDQGHLLDTRTARELADLADECADAWRQPDAGIWELQDQRQYTISKIGCWRALTHAAALAEDQVIAGRPDRWRAEAELIADWVQEHCWSAQRQSYLMEAGGTALDASVLLAGRFGFGPTERLAGTVDAVVAELGAGDGLLYRYTGMDQEEECFLACSYWLAEAYALTGRAGRGRELLTQLAGLVGPLGLQSEMVDPRTTASVGNLPQALSHLAHINATRIVAEQSRGSR